MLRPSRGEVQAPAARDGEGARAAARAGRALTAICLRSIDGHVLCRERAAEQLALGAPDAEGANGGKLVLGFDALDHDAHAQVAADGVDRANDARGLGVSRRVDVAHETLVDLDLVEGKIVEIAQRGIARAEIVERDVDADRAQLVERGERWVQRSKTSTAMTLRSATSTIG